MDLSSSSGAESNYACRASAASLWGGAMVVGDDLHKDCRKMRDGYGTEC